MDEEASVKFIKDIFGSTAYSTVRDIPISAARDLIAVTTPYLLADANVDHRFFTGCTSNVFSVGSVAVSETGGNLSHYLSPENIQLHSYTRGEFREKNGIVTVTEINGETATVQMSSINQQNNMTVCVDCGHAEVVMLTNMDTGQSVVLCNELINDREFALAIWAIAFPHKYTIITNDKCLGCSFRNFNSFTPEKGKFWKDLI